MLWLCDLLVWGCSSAFWTETTIHDFIGGVVSHVHYGCIIPLAERDRLVLSFLHILQGSGVCYEYKFLYPANVSRCVRPIHGSFNLWPRKPEWVPSCTLSHRDTLKIVFEALCSKRLSCKFNSIDSVPFTIFIKGLYILTQVLYLRTFLRCNDIFLEYFHFNHFIYFYSTTFI